MHTKQDTQFKDNVQMRLAMAVILDLIAENKELRAKLSPVESSAYPRRFVARLDSKLVR